jgi:type II secretory pathway component GspD/PulD (secretin)
MGEGRGEGRGFTLKGAGRGPNPRASLAASAGKADAIHRSGSSRRARARRGGCAWLLAAIFVAGISSAPGQDQAPPPSGTPAPQAAAVPNPPGTNAPAELTAVVTTNDLPAANTGDASTNGLRLNFRNAPIDLVLNYLSQAAGFIIELDTRVSGTVSVISSHPMTKDEAVDLLNSVLNKNGYAAVRTGERTLKIMDKGTARSSNNPVKIGNDPATIPNNDEMVTQIIPIRYVEASQLVTDLSPFVSSDARIIANQAGNSIVITDTQANIRHLAEIIKAIDTSAEDVTVLRVFHLEHADPTEMAALLTSLFPDQSGAAQSPMRFAGGRGGRGAFGGTPGGFGGGPGGFFAAMAANTTAGSGNTQSDRIKKRTQVVAVPDARTSSVVVTATKDLMDQIATMVEQLDFKSDKEQMVKVFKLDNADAQQILPVLQDMFQTTTTARSGGRGSTQSSPFQTRAQQYQNNSSSSAGTSSGFGARPGGSTGRSGLTGSGGF